MKRLIAQLHESNHNVKGNMLAAIGNVRPSHLLDPKLRELYGLDRIGGADEALLAIDGAGSDDDALGSSCASHGQPMRRCRSRSSGTEGPPAPPTERCLRPPGRPLPSWSRASGAEWATYKGRSELQSHSPPPLRPPRGVAGARPPRITRSISRFVSRSLMSWRRSTLVLPVASAIRSFARPPLK